MTKVVIDMTMSLDGFVAGPGDGKDYPLEKNEGMRIFDWYFSGKDEYRHKLFRPELRYSASVIGTLYSPPEAQLSPRPGSPSTHVSSSTVARLT